MADDSYLEQIAQKITGRNAAGRAMYDATRGGSLRDQVEGNQASAESLKNKRTDSMYEAQDTADRVRGQGYYARRKVAKPQTKLKDMAP